MAQLKSTTVNGNLSVIGTLTGSGQISGNSLKATNTITGASLSVTGKVSGASAAITGAISGASLATTGNVTAGHNASASYACYAKNSALTVRLGVNTTPSCGIYNDTNKAWLVKMDKGGKPALGTTSDKRLKNDLGYVSVELSTDLLSLPVHKFNYKDDNTKKLYTGLFAQDVRDVLVKYNIHSQGMLQIHNPKLEKDYLDPSTPEENVKYGLDYEEFIPHLIKGWQIHEYQINKLKEENKRLQKELDDIKAKLGD